MTVSDRADTFNEAVLYVLIIRQQLKSTCLSARNREGICRTCSQSSYDKSAILPTYIARFQLQASIYQLQSEHRGILRILRYLHEAYIILAKCLCLPKLQHIQNEILMERRYTVSSQNAILRDPLTAAISHSVISYLGECWFQFHEQNHPWYSFETSNDLLETFVGVKSMRFHYTGPTNSFLETLTPRFWILMLACHIGSIDLFDHCREVKPWRLREKVTQMLQWAMLTFTVVTAKRGHQVLLHHLFAIQGRDNLDARQLALVLRASILSRDLGVVEEVLQQAQDRAPDIIDRMVELGHVACLLDMDFRRRQAILGLLRAYRGTHFLWPVSSMVNAAYTLGDTELLQDHLAIMGRSLLSAFRFDITPYNMLSSHGAPHSGHVGCLDTIVEPRYGILQYTRVSAIRIMAECLLKAQRLDLFLHLYNKHLLLEEPELVVHLVLARNAESLLLKYLAAYPRLLDMEYARYPSRYIGQDALCNALHALNSANALCLLQAGARLRENVKDFTVSWTKYTADQDAFHETQALVERHGLPPLKLDI